MQKEKLLSALQLVKPALGAKNQIVGLDCFFFKGDKVVAHNGTLTTVADLDFEFPVRGCIAGNTLYRLMDACPSDIELEVKNNDLIVNAGQAKAKFPIVIAEPRLFDVPDSAEGDIRLPRSALFFEGIKRCMLSLNPKSNEAGISVFVNNRHCELYSTDGNSTFSKFEFDIEEDGVSESLVTLIPAMFCDQYVAVSTELMTTAREVAIGDGYIRAIFAGKAAIYCSFYATNVKTTIRNRVNECLELKTSQIPENFYALLKRSEIIASEGSRIVEIKYGPTLEVHADGIGQITESIEFDPNAEAGKVNVDVRLLQKAIDIGCLQIGFGQDYMVLRHPSHPFSHIISGRSL